MSLFLRPQTYYIEGAGAGYDTNGDYAAGTLTQAPFLGTIQPLNSKEIESLPEGEKDKGGVKVYSDRRLGVLSQGSVGRGAFVLFDGKYYRCLTESKYSSGLIEHYKYIAKLEK